MDKRILIIGIVIVIVGAIIAASVYGYRRTQQVASFAPITLEYWGVYEDPQDIQILTDAYSLRHPKVTIKYRSFRPEEYRQKLLEAWARDQGPDVFMIPNTWLREYQKYISPMPAKMDVPAQVVEGLFKPELVDVVQTHKGYLPQDIRNNYLDVVYQDVVIDGQVYGLPNNMDTMVLYYNRELLQNNGIPQPAKTWNDVVNHVAKMSRINQSGDLIQSGIALGETNNIPNAFDILSLLMVQVGIDMEANDRVIFADDQRSIEAINFFLGFSNANTTVYSWNEDQANAIDLFTAGKLGYFLGYGYHADIISATNPTLDWDVAPVPQAQNASLDITYANYWVNVVPQKTEHTEVAWQFVKRITSAELAKDYLDKTKKTTALLSLVEAQKNDPAIAPFADNLLTARSWYRGYNFPVASELFLKMVDDISAGKNTPTILMETAQNQITQTLRKPREEDLR